MSNKVVEGSVHINSLVCVIQLTILASALPFHVRFFCHFILLDYDTEYQITIFSFFVVVYSYVFEMLKAHFKDVFLYVYATHLLLLEIICEMNTPDRTQIKYMCELKGVAVSEIAIVKYDALIFLAEMVMAYKHVV